MTDARTDHAAPSLILASASPRRAALLQQVGARFTAVPAEIDETPLADENAADTVRRLARVKAEAVAAAYPDAYVIGADTLVECDGAALGKPVDEAHAADMLERLAGRTHSVASAVALARSGVDTADRTTRSRVTLRAIGRDEIRAYWASGEPRDKAGGYAIQGRGAIFVARLAGSYSAVVGLDLHAVDALLRRVGPGVCDCP